MGKRPDWTSLPGQLFDKALTLAWEQGRLRGVLSAEKSLVAVVGDPDSFWVYPWDDTEIARRIYPHSGAPGNSAATREDDPAPDRIE